MYLVVKNSTATNRKDYDTKLPPLVTFSCQTESAAIENSFNNRRTRVKEARNNVYDCHLSPVGRQMTIENSIFTIFDLRASIVFTFLIATYPVWLLVANGKHSSTHWQSTLYISGTPSHRNQDCVDQGRRTRLNTRTDYRRSRLNTRTDYRRSRLSTRTDYRRFGD